MDCRQPVFFVHGLLQARIVEQVAISFSRVSSWPRDWTQVSCIAGRFFTVWASRQPQTWNCVPDKKSSVRGPPLWSMERGTLAVKESGRNSVFVVCFPVWVLEQPCRDGSGGGHSGWVGTCNSGRKPFSMTWRTVPRSTGAPCCFFLSRACPHLAPVAGQLGNRMCEAEVETKAFDFCPEAQEQDTRDWELGCFRETGQISRKRLHEIEYELLGSLRSCAGLDLTLFSTPEFWEVNYRIELCLNPGLTQWGKL